MIKKTWRRLTRRQESPAIPRNWLETPLMRDYLDYSGAKPEQVLAAARDFRRGAGKEWFASGSSFATRAASFYAESQLYIYDLLTSHKNYDDAHFEAVSAEHLAYLQGHRRVLEFGGGLGSACLWFARQPGVERVYYYDVAPKHRDFARFRFQRHDPAGTIRILDALDSLPEPVDLVYSDAVLEHVVNPVDTVNQLYPLLAIGGLLVLLVDTDPGGLEIFPMHRAVNMREVRLNSVLKVMQPRHEKHQGAYSVLQKEPIAPARLAAGGHGPLRLTFLLPVTTLWGGIRQVVTLAEALATRGHAVHIVTPGERFDLNPAVAFHQVPQLTPATVPPSDVVIGTWHNTVPVAVAAAAAMQNAVSLHYCQGYEGAFPEHTRRRRGIEQTYRLPSVKVTPCPKMVGELRLRFGQEAVYLPHFVTASGFLPGQRRFAEDGCIWILIVGPFESAWKGIDTAVRAVALLRQDVPAVRVRRVSQFALTDRERALHTPDEYHAHVDAARMAELMRASDLFVSASHEEEGFGLPAIEALRSGLPCVLSRISAYLTFSVERQDYALFATPGEPAAFVAALRQLIANADLRGQLARRGSEVAAPYFEDRDALERWETFFHDLKNLGPQLAALQRALAPR